MNPRRTVILIAAIFLAAVSSIGLLNYVRSAAESAADQVAPVPVWVVSQTIPKGMTVGTAFERGLIVEQQTDPDLRPATASVDPAVELAGLVAFTDLAPNTPILSTTFVSPSVVNDGITGRLKERGLVTVTISVDPTRGVANLISPGDYVNVMVERRWDVPFYDREEPVEVSEGAREALLANLVENDAIRPILTDVYRMDSRMVYQKAEVLAVGSEVVPDIGQPVVDGDDAAPAATGLVTLAVPPEAVQVIRNVGSEDIYLSLVPDDYEPRPILPLDPTTQVLPGEDANRLTPYAGYDDVVDPTLTITDLTFADEEDRVGSVPSTGSAAEADEGAPYDGGDSSGVGGQSDQPIEDSGSTAEDGDQTE